MVDRPRHTDTSPEKLLRDVEACRKKLKDESRLDPRISFDDPEVGFDGQLNFSLPPIGPLWGAASVLGGPKLSRFQGEPRTKLAAIEMLDELAEHLRSQCEPGTTRPTKKMTIEAANAEATKLARRLGKAFFHMSKSRQAKLIGCHHRTWVQTPLFKSAVEKGLMPAPKPRAPKTVPLTKELEAVTGEGEKQEVLQKLIAEQEDPLGRERRVHSRKRQ
jgi:hypothetical protein